MAGEKYSDYAVETLGDFIAAGFAAQLRIVETDQGLAANAITDPVAYIKARAHDDNRSPIILVYEDGGEFDAKAGQRHDLSITRCMVVISVLGTANVDTSEQLVRRYLTALIQTIRADESLGEGGGVAAYIGPWAADFGLGPQNMLRKILALRVDVRAHTP